jgi:hypothetical protein
MNRYEEQIGRALRYYGRFKRLNDGMVHDRMSDEYIDDVYAFFQFCYHVKDYLVHDPGYTKHTDQQIEDKVTNTPALAICADLCNGSKHLKLKKLRSGDQPKLGRKDVTLHLTDHIIIAGGPPKEASTKISIQVEVEHKGQTLDAFQIATDAMDAWTQFI